MRATIGAPPAALGPPCWVGARGPAGACAVGVDRVVATETDEDSEYQPSDEECNVFTRHVRNSPGCYGAFTAPLGTLTEGSRTVKA